MTTQDYDKISMVLTFKPTQLLTIFKRQIIYQSHLGFFLELENISTLPEFPVLS